MLQDIAFPKHPMIDRVHTLHKQVPVTVLYGTDSWMDKSPGPIIKEIRPNSYVHIEVGPNILNSRIFFQHFFCLQFIPDAGHHINADQPEIFNKCVTEVCKSVANSQLIIPTTDRSSPSTEIRDEIEVNPVDNEMLTTNKPTDLLQ